MKRREKECFILEDEVWLEGRLSDTGGSTALLSLMGEADCFPGETLVRQADGSRWQVTDYGLPILRGEREVGCCVPVVRLNGQAMDWEDADDA